MASESLEVSVPTNKLQIGMYVTRLDRPWLETNFLLQGFVIKNQDDIDALIEQCEYVYIEGKEIPQDSRPKKHSALLGRLKKPSVNPTLFSAPECNKAPAEGKRISYINQVRFTKEMPTAKNDYREAKSTVKSIMDSIRIGRMLDVNEARQVVDDVVDSLLRNSDAMAWLSKIKHQDEYTAEHSLNVCILSSTFARYLGHSELEIKQIGLCGLLHDVGKSKIPEELLNKVGKLSDEEFNLMKQHPSLGRKLLLALPMADRIAIDVAHSHHERPDGQGYPRKLKEHEIPYYAKIVALADCYDAITSDRCYDSGRASMTALDIIYKCRGKQFDSELALQFIKCIGVYPPGSIIEFTNGEVGIVLSNNNKNKLRPRVILVVESDKITVQQRVIDLQQGATDPEGKTYVIAHELPNGSFGIDLQEFIDKGLKLDKKISENQH